MEESHIDFTLKAPFYKLNRLSDQTERVWFVFHGYGQLSKYFSRKFEHLDPNRNFLIFPQGLHKFYLPGHKKVGASWMTKEDRLTDIDNQWAYLYAVWKTCLSETDLTGKEIIFFGFSQGVATVSRYLHYSKLSINKLILWAGSFPIEFKTGDFDFLSAETKVEFIYGDDDEFYSVNQFEEKAIELKAILPQLQVKSFAGKHDLQKELLQQL